MKSYSLEYCSTVPYSPLSGRVKNSAIFSISAKEIFSQSSKVWGRSMLYLALKAARSLGS